MTENFDNFPSTGSENEKEFEKDKVLYSEKLYENFVFVAEKCAGYITPLLGDRPEVTEKSILSYLLNQSPETEKILEEYPSIIHRTLPSIGVLVRLLGEQSFLDNDQDRFYVWLETLEDEDKENSPGKIFNTLNDKYGSWCMEIVQKPDMKIDILKLRFIALLMALDEKNKGVNIVDLLKKEFVKSYIEECLIEDIVVPPQILLLLTESERRDIFNEFQAGEEEVERSAQDLTDKYLSKLVEEAHERENELKESGTHPKIAGRIAEEKLSKEINKFAVVGKALIDDDTLSRESEKLLRTHSDPRILIDIILEIKNGKLPVIEK